MRLRDKWEDDSNQYRRHNLKQKINSVIFGLAIASTGYVVDTLKACLWCLGTTDSFEEAVLKAVNLGGDTDTIGAITGTLAGAYYQLEGISEKWIQQLANRELIDEKCRQMLEWLER